MKRICVLIVLPVLAFALERVNLIKDHSFEKDSEVWKPRVYGSTYPSVAIANRHDSQYFFTGYYSGSGDTRTKPDNPIIEHIENALLTQGFTPPKILMDMDSLIINYSVFALDGDLYKTYLAPILVYLNANKDDYQKVGYSLRHPNISLNPPPNWRIKAISQTQFPDDTFWHIMEKNFRKDVEEFTNFPPEASVDSIILWVMGWGDWQGQKVYFDDVRLMGYADYDVGVKEITSVTETIPYTPAALIKNFGREPAEFSVIAEISKDETTLYADTLPWSLPSDTEDTVSFRTFDPPDTGTYLLRIYTVMEPDESDADDEQTRELHFEAIAEPPVTHPQLLALEVKPSLTTPLQVFYSLPKGHTGTLILFDLSGRRVDAKQVRGYGSATFSPEVAAGVYIVRLEAGGTTLSRKVIVVE